MISLPRSDVTLMRGDAVANWLYRYTFLPNGILLQTLTIITVILGVVSAALMPNHAAFNHHNPIFWVVVYVLDIIHGIFL